MPMSRVLPILLLAGALPLPGAATAPEPPDNPPSTVRVRDLYPLITTPAMTAARDFHVRHFGFRVLFEANWFVYLSGPADGDGRGATLAFMTPDHPSRRREPRSSMAKACC